MDKHLTIDISNPCHQQWNQMQETSQGKFCKHCDTEVIDFSGMSTDELKSYFQSSSTKVCGRIEQKQLAQFNHRQMLPIPDKRLSLKVAVLSFVALLVGCGNTTHAIGEVVVYQSAADKEAKSTQGAIIDKEKIFVVKGSVREIDVNTPIRDAIVTLPMLNLTAKTDDNGLFELVVKSVEHKKIVLFVAHSDYEKNELEMVLQQSVSTVEIKLAPRNFIMGKILMPASPVREQLSLKVPVTHEAIAVERPNQLSPFQRIIAGIGKWFHW